MASQRGGLGPEFTYDLSALKQVDPALVRFREVASIATGLDMPRGIALDPSGRLLVAGDDEVRVFASGKAVAAFATGGAPPLCVAAGPGGAIYVGLKNRVVVFDAAGKQTAAWNPLGDKAYVTGLAATEGNVFVADAGSRVLWRFDASGKLLGRIGDKDEAKHAEGLVIPSPYFSVALGPEGMLWLTNPGRRRVECYTYDGAYRFAWGKASMRIAGFCGCCNPTHLAIDAAGRFITSEKGLARVKVYTRDGEFACVVAPPTAFADGTAGLALAVDSGGRVLVLDPHRRSVRLFAEKKET